MESLDDIAPLLRTARVREFWAHFGPFMRARGHVRRSDFRPETLPRLLGWLVLLERANGGFVYRLAGSNIAGLRGGDLTGRDLAHWGGAVAEAIAAQYETVLARRRPIVAHYPAPAFRRGWLDVVPARWEKLALPLAYGDGEPDGVIVCASEIDAADAWPGCFAAAGDLGCWCARPGASQSA